MIPDIKDVCKDENCELYHCGMCNSHNHKFSECNVFGTEFVN